jgi:hypothetical protein
LAHSKIGFLERAHHLAGAVRQNWAMLRRNWRQQTGEACHSWRRLWHLVLKLLSFAHYLKSFSGLRIIKEESYSKYLEKVCFTARTASHPVSNINAAVL